MRIKIVHDESFRCSEHYYNDVKKYDKSIFGNGVEYEFESISELNDFMNRCKEEVDLVDTITCEYVSHELIVSNESALENCIYLRISVGLLY